MSPQHSEFHVGNTPSDMPHIEGLKRRGLMLAVSAPSGTGKTTMCKLLLEQDNGIQLSISATTRKPRDGEEHGKDYYFMDDTEFKRMLAERELLEHTKIHGNYYGTPRGPVNVILNSGTDILFDIDTPGVNQIAAFSRSDLVSVFILPPSAGEMERRLRGRGQEEESILLGRLHDTLDQMVQYPIYDYVIINKDIDDSMLKLRTILGAERMKRARLQGLDNFVGTMYAEAQDILKPTYPQS